VIHPLNTFCFAELYTPDVARAKKFYCDLFGWTVVDRSGMYSIFQKDGQDVVALRRSDVGESRWVSHVAVESTDRAAARVQELGGKVVMPPFDTPGVARTAVVASPEGALFGLWEARGVGGAAVQDKTGSMWWVELATADRAAARPFYTNLFGWTFGETLKYGGPGPYTIFKAGDVSAGGAFQYEPDWGLTPCWQLIFAIDDYDAALRRAEALGAEPGFNREVPETGRLSVIVDPSDAIFLVMHPTVPAT
jgi:predicted enzyme related to lactoylglutathione lyase